MIEWREEGVLLSARPHGEAHSIAEALTVGHGRVAGLVHGGQSRKKAAMMQPGTQLDLSFRARSEDALGTLSAEPMRSRAHLMGERRPLAALNAATALLRFALPEGEAHPRLYRATMRLLDGLGDAGWELGYLEWEVLLLEEAGFALDLSRCAVTGATDGLAFVSPKTGRAVTEAGAGGYAGRLLPLPPVLRGGDGGPAEVAEGLRVTGHFLARSLGAALGRQLPEARARLLDALERDGRP
ncbi:DNA replication and repair protein RecO [Hasllibacter halocynthiae]|uniref:DNA repair protein RecO n=1 Tax=Hasllibacter halocynthiae TaxID=595589 RepID=A0A2T0X3B0_9RHOB|nr:DNA repair protein RecO [Hasllibacter halocynthiae]PRY93433.1 DNA replication and repair protein RecO [Hasllibacter halocynthiae]